MNGPSHGTFIRRARNKKQTPDTGKLTDDDGDDCDDDDDNDNDDGDDDDGGSARGGGGAGGVWSDVAPPSFGELQ